MSSSNEEKGGLPLVYPTAGRWQARVVSTCDLAFGQVACHTVAIIGQA